MTRALGNTNSSRANNLRTRRLFCMSYLSLTVLCNLFARQVYNLTMVIAPLSTYRLGDLKYGSKDVVITKHTSFIVVRHLMTGPRWISLFSPAGNFWCPPPTACIICITYTTVLSTMLGHRKESGRSQRPSSCWSQTSPEEIEYTHRHLARC